MQASLTLTLDVSHTGELGNQFDRIVQQWGHLDFVVHSLASAPKDEILGH
ncbi:SDR family oxidoreductase [Pseudomonas aeruginosa]|nr:SDR family oxidoreductase [Pseudomonas aeruginosa]MCW4646449.1 SDR family oxidoreductase [Pseudomonas aeruginosa]